MLELLWRLDGGSEKTAEPLERTKVMVFETRDGLHVNIHACSRGSESDREEDVLPSRV